MPGIFPKTLTATVLAMSLLVFAACPTLAGCGSDAGEVDARCYSGDLQAAVHDAIASDRPLLLPRGKYTISKPLVIDYTEHADSGFLIISRGATIDGTAIHRGPVLEIICSGGSPANSKGCFYFHVEGTLFVNADTPDWAVRFGLDDLSDAHNSAKLDHLIVNNGNRSQSAGAVRLNYVLNSDIFVVADSAGGTGLAFEQVQFSRISGAASATTGTGLLIENGYTFSNTVQAIDFEVAQVCLTITSSQATHNTFVSPYINCKKAATSLNGSANLMINPMWGGDITVPSFEWVGLAVIP
jgi:hypothetical protein